MKYILLLIVFLISTRSVSAQNRAGKDTIPEMEYSNHNKQPRPKWEKVKLDHSFLPNSLVIVDDLIFKPASSEYKNLPKDSLSLVRFIKDDSSTSGIKYIYIYKSNIRP